MKWTNKVAKKWRELSGKGLNKLKGYTRTGNGGDASAMASPPYGKLP